MPTGYTATLHDGEQSFHDFALECARAFGALVELRDSPSAQIPDEFTPDVSYHDLRLEDARTELAELDAMTKDERDSAAAAANEAARLDHDDYKAKAQAIADRYHAMLAQVQQWTPPTAEHEGLKEFMASQLAESIRFDGPSDRPAPKALSGEEWAVERRERAERDLEYHAAEREKAIQRASARTAWVSRLRASLPAPPIS